MKKSLFFVLSLLVVASLVLTACGATPAAPATEAPAVAAPQFTCALITPNPLGDRSFIDASARGIEKANADAALAASIFHYKEIEIPELKRYLQSNKINVRI